jgi:predicted nucleic acid-binding protein
VTIKATLHPDRVRLATRGVTLDTGVLIALERRKSSALALLRACRLSRARITIPAGVLAEWWRGEHAAMLEIGTLETLSPQLALEAGKVLAQTGKSNAVDATVVVSASQRGDLVVTQDPHDLREAARCVRGVTVETLGDH